MNKEELIEKLQMVYTGDRNAFNELVGYYDGLQEVIKIVREENKELKERIDKAIEYIEESIKKPMFAEYICANDNGEVENLDKLLQILKGEK